MEAVKQIAIPESIHGKLWAMAQARKPRITLKALVVEILTKEVQK
jgi:hypothetical protein